jgi:hypothetical protein
MRLRSDPDVEEVDILGDVVRVRLRTGVELEWRVSRPGRRDEDPPDR